MSDIVSAAGIAGYARTQVAVTVLDETVSTNDDAKALAAAGCTGDAVIIARKQTGGRGRKGRGFYSPDGTGLYMSFLTHPKLNAEDALSLTTLAAVAAARAAEAVSGAEIKIKWVNDLLKNGKKICGILTEAAFSADGGIEYAVIGLGINVFPPDGGFPDDIKDIAGAVFDSRTDAVSDSANKLAALIVDELFDLYARLPQRVYTDEYRARSSVIGREVTVSKNGKCALALSVEDDLSLRVRYHDGSEECLNSGEVSVRPV